MVKKLSLTMLLSLSALSACGPGNFYSHFSKNNYYDFLPAKLVDIEEKNPLYKISSTSRIYAYHDRMDYFKEKKQQFNVQEWSNYFGNSLTEKETYELFYGRNSNLLKRYGNYAKKIDNPSFEKYLKFVERQSKNVTEYEKQAVSNATLSKEAMEAFVKEKDDFLKLRYLFLGIRLAHYGGDYKRSLALYEKHYPEVSKVESIVVEWIDALRAGALQHLGKSIVSNRLYAKIMRENKTNAHLGYYDFKIHNDKDWKALLAKAESLDEKAEFYFLRALKWEGSPLLEHEALAKVAPHSIWFERLTYMLMQEFQEEAFEYETTENKNNKYVKEQRKVYELKERHFLKTLASLKEPTFFDLYVQSYLNFLKTGEVSPEKMKGLSALAKKDEKDMVEILGYLQEVVHVKRAEKEDVSKHLASLSKQVTPELATSLFRYTALHSMALYPPMSAKAVYSKIFSDTSRQNEWYISRDAILADSFEAYVEEKNRNFYEQKLFKKSMKILEKNEVAKTLVFLHTKDGNFKKAEKYLKQVPKLNRSSIYNPFNVSLSGNNRVLYKKGYNQRKFLATMLKIEESLKKNPHSAMDHFLYANGLYNSSWFGNSPMFASIWRSTTGIGPIRAEHLKQNFEKIENEYALALKYATKKEFKAKIAYQLLKVKLTQELLLPRASYIPEFGDKWVEETLTKLVHGSEVLKNAYESYRTNYKDTKFGKETIGSCATFNYFK